MSILVKAISEIKFRIPLPVLQQTFKDDVQNWRKAPVGLDDLIMSKVIRPRVLMDANLVGGVMVSIPLNDVPMQYIDTFTVVYEIPAYKINNREIISILEVSYLPYGNGMINMNGSANMTSPGASNEVLNAAQRVGNSHSSIPMVSNASADLIGYNRVLVRDVVRITSAHQLRCMVGNDANLNNINPRSYLAFCRLCELAVKSYIYNTMLIRIDTAFLRGGQELGSFKTYIESLADSEEMYQTFLKESWQAVAFMNDTKSYNRLLKIQISPGL